jgi:hypothetical protein
MDFTGKTTQNSIDFVRQEISRKNSSIPYLANNIAVTNVVTDYDHWPYNRWYRGVYYYPEPIVAEREAGWRPIHNSCYSVNIPPEPEPQPHNCFEVACSTTLPCYPEYLSKETDKSALNVMINKACIAQYR